MENTKTAAITAEGYSFRCADKEHFEFVEKAIEKQTPKKPNKIGYPIDSEQDPLVYGCCPRCGTHRDSSKKYCSECGQKLDWSDTE